MKINAPSNRFSVLVYESWTVHHLMGAITDKVGIPSFQQRLSFNDQPLELRCLLREALSLSGTQVVELVVNIRSLDEFRWIAFVKADWIALMEARKVQNNKAVASAVVSEYEYCAMQAS